MICEIPPRSGVAFRLARGERLRVIDPQGEQVSDLLAFNADDLGEVISSGRSLDYASKIYLILFDLLAESNTTSFLSIFVSVIYLSCLLGPDLLGSKLKD